MRSVNILLLALLALPFLCGLGQAETRSGLMLRPMSKGENVELKVEVNRYLESETDAGFDYGMQLVGTKGKVRLAPELERRSPLLGWDVLYIDTDTADPRIPASLTESSVAVGLGFPVGDWIVGFTAGVGFAGDTPYNGRGWYGLGSVSTTKRVSERDFLQFGIDFDGNRPIFPDSPLPVVLWTRTWSPTLRTSIGFPYFAVTWEPVRWFAFEFRGIPGIFQTGSLIFRANKKWELFLRYRGASFRFFIDDFSNDDRRLFYTEQRAEIGVTARPLDQMEITLAVGWAFEREFSTGFDVRDTKTVANLEQTPFVGLTASYRF